MKPDDSVRRSRTEPARFHESPGETRACRQAVARGDYKNWMPKGMIYSFIGAAALSLALCLLLRRVTWLVVILAVLAFIFCALTVWSILMYRAFSYDGKRRMSAQIIEGTAARVKLPAGGKCLDVGCRSGAPSRRGRTRAATAPVCALGTPAGRISACPLGRGRIARCS